MSYTQFKMIGKVVICTVGIVHTAQNKTVHTNYTKYTQGTRQV